MVTVVGQMNQQLYSVGLFEGGDHTDFKTISFMKQLFVLETSPPEPYLELFVQNVIVR